MQPLCGTRSLCCRGAKGRVRGPEARSPVCGSAQEASTFPSHMVPELTLEAFSLRKAPVREKKVRRLFPTNAKFFTHLPPHAICPARHPCEGKLEAVPGQTAWREGREQRGESVPRSPACTVCHTGVIINHRSAFCNACLRGVPAEGRLSAVVASSMVCQPSIHASRETGGVTSLKSWPCPPAQQKCSPLG